MKRTLAACGLLMSIASAGMGKAALGITGIDAVPRAAVGLSGEMTVVLPSGATVGPQDVKSDVLVEIVSSVRLDHGVRTTLRFWPMTLGDHDLRDNLLAADARPLTSVPPLWIHAVSSLPADWKGQLAPVHLSSMARYGGYRTLRIGAIIVWVVALFPIVLVRRRRRAVPVPPPPEPLPAREISLADLVAAQASLSPRERHRLEMLLLREWQTTHGLAGESLKVALRRLHTLPQTAEPLKQLQTWLHAPEDRSVQVDTRRLLSPYASENRS